MRCVLPGEPLTPVDDVLIPTGELAAVTGTPMDLLLSGRSARPCATVEEDEQVRRAAGGFDHNWVIDGSEGGGEQLAAQVREPTTGRTLEVWTDQPGVQFYTGSLWTARWSGRTAAPTRRATRSAWRPSTSRTPPTSRRSRRPCSAAGETFGPAPSSGSADGSAHQLAAPPRRTPRGGGPRRPPWWPGTSAPCCGTASAGCPGWRR